nr:hypothetical protein [uncultured Gellertiella sp.]
MFRALAFWKSFRTMMAIPVVLPIRFEKSGKATPKHEMELVERRLKVAQDHFNEQTQGKRVEKHGRQQT